MGICRIEQTKLETFNVIIVYVIGPATKKHISHKPRKLIFFLLNISFHRHKTVECEQ